jgi:hypothetical protein
MQDVGQCHRRELCSHRNDGGQENYGNGWHFYQAVHSYSPILSSMPRPQAEHLRRIPTGEHGRRSSRLPGDLALIHREAARKGIEA